jgi:hypothetical protein
MRKSLGNVRARVERLAAHVGRARAAGCSRCIEDEARVRVCDVIDGVRSGEIARETVCSCGRVYKPRSIVDVFIFQPA